MTVYRLIDRVGVLGPSLIALGTLAWIACLIRVLTATTVPENLVAVIGAAVAMLVVQLGTMFVVRHMTS